MRITSVGSNVTFGRALTNEELKEYRQVLSKGKAVVGQTGKSIFIMPTQSLPQKPDLNTGIASISSDTAQEYIKFMHSILGFNVLEDLPPGQIAPYPNDFHCNYRSTSLALGDQHINPELLTKSEFASLLTMDEVREIASKNNRKDKHKFANFSNIMDENGGLNTALKKAYERFGKLDASHPLKARFDKYVKENSEWIDFLYKDKGEYFKFKQFLADEHLKIGKDKLNKMGIKYCGDCLIGATPQEVIARPSAFYQDWNLGWHLPILNIEDVLRDGSDANKYLEYKIKNFARRYDSIRFDVGWAYVQPRLFKNFNSSMVRKPNLGDSVLKKIEGWVKEVKGNNFDLKDLIWEFEAGPEDFEWCKDGKIIEPLKNRVKVYSTLYMDSNWGSNDAFLRRDFGADNFVVGVGNQDPQPLRQISENVKDRVKCNDKVVYLDHKTQAIEPLAKILKLNKDTLSDPVEFSKAKFAEPMMAKNMMEFFMDVFGYRERFDKHSFNIDETPDENYAHKIRYDFKKQYYDAVESGFGVNKMDSLEKIFKSKGFDKTKSDLYKLIVKYRDILYEKTPELNVNNSEPVAASAKKNKFLAPMLALGAVCTAGGTYFCYKQNSKTNNSDGSAKLIDKTV